MRALVVSVIVATAHLAAADQLKLVIEDDDGKVTVVPLLEDRDITFGRVEGNLIRLTQRDVSPRHAHIICHLGNCTVEDLQSDNGTRLDGKPLTRKSPLRDKDVLQIGGYKLFVTRDGVRSPRQPAVLIMGAKRFVLDRDTIDIGSAADNQIVLGDKSVAAHHARIERTHDHYRLVDLGGGIQIGADTYYRVELIDGDDVLIGASRLRFKDSLVTASERTRLRSP